MCDSNFKYELLSLSSLDTKQANIKATSNEHEDSRI